MGLGNCSAVGRSTGGGQIPKPIRREFDGIFVGGKKIGCRQDFSRRSVFAYTFPKSPSLASVNLTSRHLHHTNKQFCVVYTAILLEVRLLCKICTISVRRIKRTSQSQFAG